jgi:hypothetical protein
LPDLLDHAGMEAEMTRDNTTSDEMIERGLQSFREAGGTDEACARAAMRAVIDEGPFAVGDEVACTCGSLAGVIIEMHDGKALISWSCRGKSVEPVSHLMHIPHGG